MPEIYLHNKVNNLFIVRLREILLTFVSVIFSEELGLKVTVFCYPVKFNCYLVDPNTTEEGSC